MGRIDADAMLEEISSRQYGEWQAFWQVEPWGEQREDWRMANLMALILNALRGKDQPAITPQQVLARLDPTGNPEEPEAETVQSGFEESVRAMLGEA